MRIQIQGRTRKYRSLQLDEAARSMRTKNLEKRVAEKRADAVRRADKGKTGKGKGKARHSWE